MACAGAAPRTRAAARPMPAIPAMLAIRAGIFFGLVMVGTSLAPRGRLLRSGRLVRQGYEGLVLGPERLAGDPLDVRRRHRLILGEALVDGVHVTGRGDGLGHLVGHAAGGVEPEGKAVAQVRLDAVETL